MYTNVPFGGASTFDGSFSNMGSATSLVFAFAASNLADTLLLIPLLTKTVQPKRKLVHVHHYYSLIYIVEE